MKKILVLLIVFILLTACHTQKLSKEDELYYHYVDKLNNCTQYIENTSDFSLSLHYEKIDKEYCYVLVLDKTVIPMYDIVFICDGGEKEMLPSVGIYDVEEYHLIPNKIDKVNGFYKGLQLSGLVTEKKDIRVYLHYYTDKQKTKDKEMFIKVKV